MMLPKDYVRLRMCGKRATDVSDASGTLLFDVASGDGAPRFCRRWKSRRRCCLRCWRARHCRASTASGVPVAAGAGDQAAGALGVGVTRPGPLSVVLGTSGVVFAAAESIAPTPWDDCTPSATPVPDGWHVMGVMLSAAGSLGWARDVMAPGTRFADLLAGAEGWAPGVEGLTFLPYLAGERTPHADPDARGAFCGLGLRHDRGALIRAVLEGVAFGLRDCLDADPGDRRRRHPGAGHRGRRPQRAVVVDPGLGAGDPADAHGGGRGCRLRSRAAGRRGRRVWEDPDAAAPPPSADRGDRAGPEWVAPYAEARERFRALYPALRDARRGQRADERPVRVDSDRALGAG